MLRVLSTARRFRRRTGRGALPHSILLACHSSSNCCCYSNHQFSRQSQRRRTCPGHISVKTKQDVCCSGFGDSPLIALDERRRPPRCYKTIPMSISQSAPRTFNPHNTMEMTQADRATTLRYPEHSSRPPRGQAVCEFIVKAATSSVRNPSEDRCEMFIEIAGNAPVEDLDGRSTCQRTVSILVKHHV